LRGSGSGVNNAVSRDCAKKGDVISVVAKLAPKFGVGSAGGGAAAPYVFDVIISVAAEVAVFVFL
jgi:hypothetical protein